MKKTLPVWIVGAGLAGLCTALELASYGYACAVISEGESPSASASFWAQGGIAATKDDQDLPIHIEDTLKTASYTNDAEVVRHILSRSRASIDWLIEQGVSFQIDSSDGDRCSGEKKYHQVREGGHSVARIFHVSDATGSAIMHQLFQRAMHHPLIQFYFHTSCIALDIQSDQCVGLWIAQNGHTLYCSSLCVVLACGGASGLYRYSTHPSSLGHGIALAKRAGCQTYGLAFQQFHPTTFYVSCGSSGGKNLLISEALRGSGAYLCTEQGDRWMLGVHADAELAPRDIVSRSMMSYLEKKIPIFLDARHLPESVLCHFSFIDQHLKQNHIDFRKDRIPITPSAHYSCGGVVVDQQGCTHRHRLYAVGEVSYTGFHGANRMASHSLLECIVFGRSVAEHIRMHDADWQVKPMQPSQTYPSVIQSQSSPHFLSFVRQMMWEKVGIIRRLSNLKEAVCDLQGQLDSMKHRSFEDPLSFLIAQTALLIAQDACKQPSVGTHYLLNE